MFEHLSKREGAVCRIGLGHMTELVTVRRDGAVLRVSLNRPEKRNALSRPLIAEIHSVFKAASKDNDLSLVVLTGEGHKAFAAGGDLKELNSLRSLEQALSFAADTRSALDEIRQFPVPVVALLNGDALGGGAELAVACDLRIAQPHARIGFVQGTLNIATAWGGGTDLFRIVAPNKALSLLCTAEILDAKQALHIGLIDAIVPDTQGEEFIDGYVRSLAARPPQVMRAFKSLAIQSRSPSADSAANEGRNFAATWVHDDHWQALEAMAKHVK